MAKTVKYDTNETGWETILKDYRADLLVKFIQEWRPGPQGPIIAGTGVAVRPFEMNSGEAHRYELEQLKKKDRTISRASIIFGLNAMVDTGLLTYREKTGKGGYHRLYRLAMTPHELEVLVTTRILYSVKETWPDAYSEVTGAEG